VKDPDGTVTEYPTSGGADRFLEFIQSELVPEIDKRYRTVPLRIFAGHSLGGLLAVHALIARPDLFYGYIAVSPSLQWDGGRTRAQAQRFFAERRELKKVLFLSLANEGDSNQAMSGNFDELGKALAAAAPKGLSWESARYPDEDHGSTVLRGHYAGLRAVFASWAVQRDAKTRLLGGGLAGIERHHRSLSERFGYPVQIPERTLNRLGYQLLEQKKLQEAIAVFQRNVELHPESANVHDSLGEAQEAAGLGEAARQSYQKAVAIGTQGSDRGLDGFKRHLERLAAPKPAVK